MDDHIFLSEEASTRGTFDPRQLDSPFTTTMSFESTEQSAGELHYQEHETPFISDYEQAEQQEASDPRRQQLVQMLDEISDDEFGEAIVDLANEAEEYLDTHFGNVATQHELPNVRQQEEMLRSHFQPLIITTEQFLDQLMHEFGAYQTADLTDHFIDQTIDQQLIKFELGNPTFEQFFKKFRNKVKKFAKKAVSVVKKGINIAKKFSPINLALGKIKKMIRPLLAKIITKVISRLPPLLRTPANMLAKRLGLQVGQELSVLELAEEELEKEASLEPETSTFEANAAAIDFEALAPEFDRAVTWQFFAETDADAQLIADQYANEQESITDRQALQQYETARDLLVKAIHEARTQEEITPQVEQFIGTALTVIRLGVRLIGRKRVINFIAKLFTKLIGKLIGPKAAQPLAYALVNHGFKLLRLEVSEAEAEQEAALTIVQTLEELSYQVAGFDQEVLEDEEQLEYAIYERFTQLVAENFPSSMVQPELRESEISGAWVLQPINGTKRYKKFSQVVEINLSRDKVKDLHSFGGESLIDFLKLRSGLNLDRTVKAKVHIYQAIRGTTLSHIALKEKGVKGLGSAQRAAWSQLHPLTPKVAGQLLDNPSLGVTVSSKWLRSRHLIRNGQRFYFIELLPSTLGIQTVTPAIQMPHSMMPLSAIPGNMSNVVKNEAMVKLDFTRSTMTLALLLTEDKAAEMVRRIRTDDYFGAAIVFRAAIRDALNNILLKHASKQLKVVMETTEDQYLEEHFSSLFRKGGSLLGGAAVAALQLVMQKLMKKLVDRAIKAITEHLRTRKNDFIKAQEDPQQGLSLHLIFIDMPGMAQLKIFFKVKKGEPLSVGDLINPVLGAIPMPDLRIFPGRKSL